MSSVADFQSVSATWSTPLASSVLNEALALMIVGDHCCVAGMGRINDASESRPAFRNRAATELYAKNLKLVEEEIKIHGGLRPTLATPNRVRLDLRTMVGE